MATNVSHDSTANPTKDAPSSRGRDTRKGAQEDGSTETTNKVTQNNPPNNKNAADKGSVAKFLQWCHPQTPLQDADTLSEKWSYWHPRDVDEKREPRADPAPVWDDAFGGAGE